MIHLEPRKLQARVDGKAPRRVDRHSSAFHTLKLTMAHLKCAPEPTFAISTRELCDEEVDPLSPCDIAPEEWDGTFGVYVK